MTGERKGSSKIDELLRELAPEIRRYRHELSSRTPPERRLETQVPTKHWNDCSHARKSCCSEILQLLSEEKGLDGKRLHKRKVSSTQKLACIADRLPVKDSVAPILVHLFRRFAAGRDPGNEFEKRVFGELRNWPQERVQALARGFEAFEELPRAQKAKVCRDEFLDLPETEPANPVMLMSEWIDEGLTLARAFRYDRAVCLAKVRPWEQRIYLPKPGVEFYSEDIIGPWPWINEVDGLRTRDHRMPIGNYLPEEYETDCQWQMDANGNTQGDCKYAMSPSCEVVWHEHNGTCLRVPASRPGQTVELIGFNFFSRNCKVLLTSMATYQAYTLDADVCGDSATPLTGSDGAVIADHRVRDVVSFQIPEWTPDGLSEFAPGLYSIQVVEPNDIDYTYPDGSQPSDFRSNAACIKVLPAEGLRYRLWSDQIHCYDATDGEWFSDEIYMQAYRVVFSMADGTPQKADLGSTKPAEWDDADGGETHDWLWDIVGEAGNPFPFTGAMAIGIIGYEVDSEDALKKQVKSFGDAFSLYFETVWTGLLAAVGGLAALGAILKYFASLSLKWTLVAVAIVLIVVTVIGLIWAAWAPADRMAQDLLLLAEQDLYYLTHPNSPKPGESARSIDDDITERTIPDSKINYLYTEERQYSSRGEGSRYGIRLLYQREV